MDTHRYIFVGNRFFCLEEMLRLGLDIVRIFAVKGSFLAEELHQRGFSYVPVESKAELVHNIKDVSFDVLVSNGCPYILPIGELQTGENRFVNMHPSLLPDLKGRHPINGAILHQRRHGATCHIMDDGIDTGKIIAQVEIPHIGDLPLDLLYQLSFLAEKDAFKKAYARNFEPDSAYEASSGVEPIYYSRSPDDMVVRRDDGIDLIVRKVKAFQIDGLYARFARGTREYQIHDLSIIENDFLEQYHVEENTIFLIFGSNVLTREEGHFCLWRLDTAAGLKTGDQLLL